MTRHLDRVTSSIPHPTPTVRRSRSGCKGLDTNPGWRENVRGSCPTFQLQAGHPPTRRFDSVVRSRSPSLISINGLGFFVDMKIILSILSPVRRLLAGGLSAAFTNSKTGY